MHTLLVYASRITKRLSYIVDTLFGGLVLLTDSKEQFLSFTGVRINYSKEHFDADVVWIVPQGLLDETGIHEQAIVCEIWEEQKIFFKTGGDIPFDIFAASFYLLSRYEEYLPHEVDQYGRYSHTNSVAYKNAFLNIPLVNLWLQLFEKILQNRFPHSTFNIQHSTFQFVPTYDIDEAFAYLHKPLWQNVGGFYRDLLMGKFEQVIERGNVYSGRKPDPYDVFEWMDSLHTQYRLQPVYFFLTIIRRGEYDKNLDVKSKALQALYKKIAATYKTGLHPSWQSGTEEWLLKKEKQTLEEIIHQPIYRSRNHYLRFTVPHTYRRLIDAGITDDYSMAYGNVNGFRASYARPYQWYDLEKEIVTGLTIHPFCFMEATSFFNQGFTAAQAGEELKYYYDLVKKVDGEFITLFHNHFLTEQLEWMEWRKMYADFLGQRDEEKMR